MRMDMATIEIPRIHNRLLEGKKHKNTTKPKNVPKNIKRQKGRKYLSPNQERKQKKCGKKETAKLK